MWDEATIETVLVVLRHSTGSFAHMSLKDCFRVGVQAPRRKPSRDNAAEHDSSPIIGLLLQRHW